MATLIPPFEFLGEAPFSEQKVLAVLRELPDDWRVFSGVRFLVPPSASQPAVEREIDLLLLHPEHGMLALEVKGGGIDYDLRGMGGYFSIDRAGRKNRIENPFDQASTALHCLKKLIEGDGRWSGGTVDFVHASGVITPDCDWAPRVPPPGARRELVIDRSDLTDGRAEARLVALSQFWAANRGASLRPLGRQRLKKLAQEVLAPHFGLRPTLEGAMAWEETALLRLAEDQEQCLDFLALNPRAKVVGCAGSGKTLVAVERARRLAAGGAKVLFLCFNRPLGHHLRVACEAEGPFDGSIAVRTFHQFCREQWEKAGNEWDEPAPGTVPAEASGFWKEETARRLGTALQVGPERWDALVVDEAQDFETPWWETLHWALAEPERSPVALFLDPAQDLYGRSGDFGLPLPVFPLRANRRSTRAIAEFAARLGGVRVRHPHGVPDGEEPTVSSWTTAEEERRLVEGKLRWLLEEEKVPLGRIVVIGTRRLENSFLGREPKLWGLPVESIDDEGRAPTEGSVRYSTIQRFKGLDADVVLLVDVDGSRHACTPVHLHVAASRARHRLYVFAREGFDLAAAARG